MADTNEQFEEQLDALEAAMLGVGSRLEATTEKAKRLALEFAQLQAKMAAVGMNKAMFQSKQAETAGASAQAETFQSRFAGIEEMLAGLRKIGTEAASSLAPKLALLARRAEELSILEARRATIEAQIVQREQQVKSLEASGAGTPGAGSAINASYDSARKELEKLKDSLAAVRGKSLELGSSFDSTRQRAMKEFQQARSQTTFASRVKQMASRFARAYSEAPQRARKAITGLASKALSPATATVGALGELGSQVGQFVQAFSPSTMLRFNQAIQDLTATIGRALEPVMEVLVQVVREVADRMLPLAEKLAPIFGKLAETVMQTVVPIIDVWMAALGNLTPALDVVADVFKNVATIARVSTTIYAGAIEQLKEWLTNLFPSSDNIKSWTDSLRLAVQEAAKWILTLAASFASLVGATGFVRGMQKSLSAPLGGLAQRKDSTGQAAAQQARFTGITEFGQSVATAAFTATGSDQAKKTDNQWLEDLSKTLKGIEKQGPEQAKQMIDAFFAKFAEYVTGPFNAWVDRKIDMVISKTKDKAWGAASAVIGPTATGNFEGAAALLREWGLIR